MWEWEEQAGEELAVAPPGEALTHLIEAELPRLEALNEPDDDGEVDELTAFFCRYALAAQEEESTTPSVSAIRKHRQALLR